MFIKDTERYSQYVNDSTAKPYTSKEYQHELFKKINLSSTCRNDVMYAAHMNYLADFVYWADNEDFNDLISGLKPVGFEIDSLDDLEEIFFHLIDFLKSDEGTEEEKAHYVIKKISAFIAATLHYQYGYEYAYLSSYNSSMALGIRFPSGHEFCFYAYFNRLNNMMNALKQKGDDPGKYNGLTKSFLKAMIRVEEQWDIKNAEQYNKWYSKLSEADKRCMEKFFKHESKIFSVSLFNQETNADSIPMIFAYYCRDLLLDYFDGSLISFANKRDITPILPTINEGTLLGMDDFVIIKLTKMIAEGGLVNTPESRWQACEAMRMRLGGLFSASWNVTSPIAFSFLYKTDQYSVMVTPYAANMINKTNPVLLNESIVSDEELFAGSLDRYIDELFNQPSAPASNRLIQKTCEKAFEKLSHIQRRHISGNGFDGFKLGNKLLSEMASKSQAIERPEKIFASQRSLCYKLDGELRGRKLTDTQLFQEAILMTMNWLNSRFFAPASHLENPLYVFDTDEYTKNGFPSLSFEGAFSAQIYSFPEQKKWFMRVYESDLGVYLDDDHYIPGEPGRFVETHISFWCIGDKLYASLRTFVTHSYNKPSNYKGSCAGLIDILRDNEIDFFVGSVMKIQPLICETYSDINKYTNQRYIGNSDLPMLICTYHEVEDLVNVAERQQKDQQHSKILPFNNPSSASFTESSLLSNNVKVLDENTTQDRKDKAWSDYDKLWRGLLILTYRCAYRARIVLVPAQNLDRFKKSSGLQLNEDSITLFFGGVNRSLSAITIKKFVANPQAETDKLLDKIIEHLNETTMEEDDGFSYRAALELASEENAKKITVNAEWQAYHDNVMLCATEKHARELEHQLKEHEKVLLQNQREIKNLEQKIDDMIAERTSSNVLSNASETIKEISMLESERNRYRMRMLYLESYIERPREFDEIADWVSSKFNSTLQLLPRAQKELKSIKSNEYNLPLLCDSLEYLATDYYESLVGIIDEETLMERFDVKYKRPFSVTPNKSGVNGEYSEQYQVTWQNSKRELDLHLRVGNTRPYLIRIYFFYDKDEKKIFVGSLPRHLDT